MTKWWRKYWKEKLHRRKGVCDDLMGIDSFHIFENKKLFAMKREDYFAFNNYDKNSERILNVKLRNDEFCFYIIEDRYELVAALFQDGFHVVFREFFHNASRFPTITKRASYKIAVERQQCNGCVFFRCPGKECNRRMRKLYYSHGDFLCRKCLNLNYRSQRISPFARIKRDQKNTKRSSPLLCLLPLKKTLC